MIARRCINCGTLTRQGTRCQRCTQVREQLRNLARRDRYGGDYPRLAAEVRASVVYGVTVCWRCGETIDVPPVDADHAPHGLVPTHAACNRGKRLPERGGAVGSSPGP